MKTIYSSEETAKKLKQLAPLLEDERVTDIDCNSKSVWLTYAKHGYKQADINISNEELEAMAYDFSNLEDVQFNQKSPILQAGTDELRLEFTHNTISPSGTSLTIRKTPVKGRMNEKDALKESYMTSKISKLFKIAILSHFNTITCGEKGSGKTELDKFLIKFIPLFEKKVSIEDILELHLAEILPQNSNYVEMKVNDKKDYSKAIRATMRMNALWVLFGECRGAEVKELIESVSTSAYLISSIHCPKAIYIPDRYLNMFETNELSNDKIRRMIHNFLDLGIHIKCIKTETETIRYIDEIVYFYTEEEKCLTSILYEKKKGKDIYYPLPEHMKDRLCTEIEWEEKK